MKWAQTTNNLIRKVNAKSLSRIVIGFENHRHITSRNQKSDEKEACIFSNLIWDVSSDCSGF